MEVALISTALFKQYSPLKDDTDIAKFVPYVLMAQQIYILPIIGKPLYDELQEQIKLADVIPVPDPNPISAANRALLQKIAPTLSQYAVYQGLPSHAAAIVNKGVTMRSSDNSDPVTFKDLAQLRRWIKDDAEVLANQLISYLSGCGDYPLWKPDASCGCGDNGTGSTKSPFEAGIHIPSWK